MMKLDTMGMLVGTLNERGGSPVADAIAARWDHEPGTVRFFRASANFLFLFELAGQSSVLRFIESSERTSEMIRAELGYIRHLAARGVRLAGPIPSLQGNLIETVATEQGTFHAVVFERLAGERFESEDMTPGQMIHWGQALGELHNAAEGYSDTGRPTWQDHLELVSAGLPENETAAWATLRRVQEQLERAPVRQDNFGLIHFDFEPDNLIWDNAQVGVVDFDDCAHYWFAADIAFALRDAFGDRADTVDLENDTARHFIRGYRLARRIDDDELERVPLYLALHNLFTLTRLFHSLEPIGQRQEADWLVELRQKLWRKIEFYREGFVHR